MKRDVHLCFVTEMCLRSFCVTCVQLLFIRKCVCVPVFPGLAEGEESAQVHGGQRCHALQPSDLHRGQLVDRTALAERCYFFPCLLQRLPVISFFLPFSALPFLSMSLCLLCYFCYFFPHSKIQQVTSSGLKAVWCFDCGSDRKCVRPFPCVRGLWGKVS